MLLNCLLVFCWEFFISVIRIWVCSFLVVSLVWFRAMLAS